MKNLKLRVITLLFLVLIVSCKKDEDKGFVDAYSPQLNEDKGKIYKAVDFFPLEDSLQWEYNFTEISIGNSSANYGGGLENDKWNKTSSGTIAVYTHSEKKVVIGGQKIVGYPFYKNIDYDDEGMRSYPSEIRFIKNGNVCKVDYSLNNSQNNNVLEFDNEYSTIMMKSDLVVGDSWENENFINILSKQSDETDVVSASGKSKYFVLGMTKLKVNGTEENVLQIDEVKDYTVTMTLNYTSDVKVTITHSVAGIWSTYLKEGVGVIFEESDYTTFNKSVTTGNGANNTSEHKEEIEFSSELTSFGKR